jgi:hypothetical protein
MCKLDKSSVVDVWTYWKVITGRTTRICLGIFVLEDGMWKELVEDNVQWRGFGISDIESLVHIIKHLVIVPVFAYT